MTMPDATDHGASVTLIRPGRPAVDSVVPGASETKGRRSLPRLPASAIILMSLCGIIAIWELVVVIGNFPQYLLPTPAEVAEKIGSAHSLLLDGAKTTVYEVLIGFALAVGFGIPMGIGIAFSRPLERAVFPLLVGSQAIPKVAVAPLFLVWFGFGVLPKILIAALIAFFPLVVETVLGMRQIDPDMVRMAKATGASATRVFLKVRLPNALAHIFAGLKIAITFSVTGAVVGEFVAGTSGLGYIVQNAQGLQQTSLAFAAIVVLAVLSLILFYLVEAIERRVVRG